MVIRRLLLLAAVATAAFATEGGMPGAFLNYGAGPRSLALGKAFTAIADDAEAGYFNPGGLFQLNAHEVILAHSQLLGARMEYVSYAMPTREYGTFGLTLVNFGAEGVPSRTPNNEGWDNYFFAENAYMVSYCYDLFHSTVGLGTNLKVIAKNLAQYSDVGFGIDLGVLVKAPKPLSFGLTAQNVLVPTIQLRDIPEKYPRQLRLGAAARLLNGRATVSLDASMPLLYATDEAGNPTSEFKPDITPHGGVEFEIVPGILYQRAGLDPNEISVGLGVHKAWGKAAIGVDYAFLLHHQSNYRVAPTHKAGLFLSFAGFRVWLDASPSVFTPTIEGEQNVLWMDVHILGRTPTKRWQILLKNQFSEIVRTYSGWEDPPLRLSWDGLDDAGRLVADGRYVYEIVVVDSRNTSLSFSGFLTQVLTQGPRGKVGIRPGE